MAVFRIASSPARPDASLAPARRPLPARRLLLLAVGVLALALLAVGSPAGAVGAQDPGASTTAGLGGPSTTAPVTTAAPATTAGSETTPAPASSGGPGSKQVADENRKIWLVVGALVAVALALTLLTVRYWRHTRPLPTPVGVPPTGDTPPGPAVRGGRLEHDVADEAVPVAVAATVAHGLSSDEVPSVDAMPAGEAPSSDEVPSDGPPELWAPADAGGLDTGPPTEALPVVVGEEDVARTSRRSVAGADHSGADEGWEPRGTGEHDRVVISPAERRARPTAAQRAAAFAARKQ